MNTPAFLLSAALLFWGWQTELLLFAAPLALALEGSRLVAWRWDLSLADFNRVADVSRVLLLGVIVYQASTNEVARALTTIFQWLPLISAPLALAQVYSTADRINLSVLFWSLRRRAVREGSTPSAAVNLTYPYFALSILAASAANVRTPSFYVGLGALAAWALWRVRLKRFSAVSWGCLFLAAGVMGYSGHLGLHNLQRLLENTALEWLSDRLGLEVDPYRSTTAIGQIGTLKLSGRIVLRIEPRGGNAPPPLLRGASYNVYDSPTWLAIDAGFHPVQPAGDGTIWTLQSGSPPSQSVSISAYLRHGKGILALPNSPFRIDGLQVVGMNRNRLGAVKVEEGLGLIHYTVLFGPGTAFDDPPNAIDLRIPPREAPVLARIAAELGLASRSPRDVLETVAAFFRTNFRYSMFLPDRKLSTTPLEDFLLRSRAGHCEYFATATVLLLRAAGLPARYATGYSVQEFSRLESRYVVRARHAHSWALVYLDGAWRDVDTTPPSWVPVESDAASSWEPLYDLWSWGAFLFSKWRWGEREGGVGKHVGWLLIPLIVILAWRVYFRKRVARSRVETTQARPLPAHVGADSEFYTIERRLSDLGLGRDPWEPLPHWIQRVATAQAGSLSTDSLKVIVSLHYRYRFDPNGIGGSEREALRSLVQSWLARHRTTR